MARPVSRVRRATGCGVAVCGAVVLAGLQPAAATERAAGMPGTARVAITNAVAADKSGNREGPVAVPKAPKTSSPPAVATGLAAKVPASGAAKSAKASTASPSAPRGKAVAAGSSYQPVAFAELPGWADDDHLAALKAFARSCARLHAAARAGNKPGATPTPPALLAACTDAAALLESGATRVKAKAFFEEHFAPHRVAHAAPQGLLTAYYEPVIEGARTAGPGYKTPIYKRPGDLMNLVSEAERGAKAEQLTHARKTAGGWEPYPTRQEIESGALAGQGLELLYLKDPVDVFFMQVQGSGRIALDDGSSVRVTYDGKNGHPYSSIGKYLIDNGLVAADKMSLQALKTWLRRNPERAREVLWQNRSYVFFRELAGEQADGPLGVLEIPLTPGRSLAVDTAHHAIGLPVYVSAGTLSHITRDDGGFHRLMVAQDVGSAIRGPERGDIYVGSGPKAGSVAGITKHPGNFFVLLPRDLPGAQRGTVIEAEAKPAGPSASVRAKTQRQASQ